MNKIISIIGLMLVLVLSFSSCSFRGGKTITNSGATVNSDSSASIPAQSNNPVRQGPMNR